MRNRYGDLNIFILGKTFFSKRISIDSYSKSPLDVFTHLFSATLLLCLTPVFSLSANSISAYHQGKATLSAPLLSKSGASRLEINECAFSQKFNKYKAECGIFIVSESHASPADNTSPLRMVSIPIVIFQPEGEVTGKPLVVTGGGGPGSAIYIMKDFDGDPELFYSGIEASTLQNGRQLILMEMRGSGESKPNLDCPAMTELEIDLLTTYPYQWDNQAVIKTQAACAKTQRSQGIDGNLYNTDYAVQDIDALRALLNIEQWHLLGISHGSRISLRYAQKYPQHTASLILDSIYPFAVDPYIDISDYTKQIFTQPFSLCDANPLCRLESQIPSIYAFEALLQQIKRKPLLIDVELFDENWNAETKKMKISPELLTYALVNNSYDAEAVLAFPFVVKDALKKDYKKLSKLISETIDLQNYTWFSEGAYASYACYEEIPFANMPLALDKARQNKLAFWDDEVFIQLDQQLCKIWNIKPANNDIKTFDYSQLTTPMLILAGELDAYTPLNWAKDFYARLPLKNKTQHLRIWPLKAHNVVYDDACVESVISSFLDSPEQTIDNACAVTDISMLNRLEVENEADNNNISAPKIKVPEKHTVDTSTNVDQASSDNL